MATPTNTQIWAEVVKLRSELLEQGRNLVDLTADVGGLTERMDSYDKQAAENNKLLKEVKAGMDFLKGSFRLVKWAGIAICSAALWQVGTLLFHLIFGH